MNVGNAYRACGCLGVIDGVSHEKRDRHVMWFVRRTSFIEMTPTRYLGGWRSVSDLRAQLGGKKFDAFLAFVEHRIRSLKVIEATYLTRAWSRRRDHHWRLRS